MRACACSHIACFVRSYVFDSVKSFVMFAGYPRSGHTLIATMLDAHPQIVMADEYHVLHPEHAHLLEGDDPLRLYSEVSQWSTYVWSKGLASKDSVFRSFSASFFCFVFLGGRGGFNQIERITSSKRFFALKTK